MMRYTFKSVCWKTQPFAAQTMISTNNRGSASFASPQARAGACPVGTQASHTAFIASKSAMSASQIVVCSICFLDEPASSSKTSMRASASRVYASTAAVPELTFKARMLVSETYQTNLIYFFLS
ncbi:polar amino acid transport system permease protein/cystine transport system permease protein [Pseudomonas arsenicoxydans]|uniref:Polar amino acid transport system permease protein/cystine transport system permease protein n=1 Tax=Pseudomonas arsenicoxydans TaxID=702115 RepID=A0A1H0Q7Q9_9PSED|nr:polar amino acid transport system permease protein/cystine transport system permease protein [Pseudomonas arsenicoxydans]